MHYTVVVKGSIHWCYVQTK